MNQNLQAGYGNALGSSSGSLAPRDTSPVDQVKERIIDALLENTALLNQLVERLSPVIRPPSPQAVAGEKEPEALSSLHGGLLDILRMAKTETANLREVIQRLVV